MAKKRKQPRDRTIMASKEAVEMAREYRQGWQEVKEYPIESSFRARLETATLKYENAIDEMIIHMKGMS